MAKEALICIRISFNILLIFLAYIKSTNSHGKREKELVLDINWTSVFDYGLNYCIADEVFKNIKKSCLNSVLENELQIYLQGCLDNIAAREEKRIGIHCCIEMRKVLKDIKDLLSPTFRLKILAFYSMNSSLPKITSYSFLNLYDKNSITYTRLINLIREWESKEPISSNIVETPDVELASANDMYYFRFKFNKYIRSLLPLTYNESEFKTSLGTIIRRKYENSFVTCCYSKNIRKDLNCEFETVAINLCGDLSSKLRTCVVYFIPNNIIDIKSLWHVFITYAKYDIKNFILKLKKNIASISIPLFRTYDDSFEKNVDYAVNLKGVCPKNNLNVFNNSEIYFKYVHKPEYASRLESSEFKMGSELKITPKYPFFYFVYDYNLEKIISITVDNGIK